MQSDGNTDGWRYRRLALFLALIWQMLAATWILYAGYNHSDTPLYDQAFIAIAGTSTSLLCAYIFGAVWDDHNRRMTAAINPPQP